MKQHHWGSLPIIIWDLCLFVGPANQASEYHQGHHSMGPARGAFSPGGLLGVQLMGFNGWTIKKTWFFDGHFEYYDNFMDEQPSPPFFSSWLYCNAWKCWEKRGNPHEVHRSIRICAINLRIIPNFCPHTCRVFGLAINGYNWHRMGDRVFLESCGTPKPLVLPSKTRQMLDGVEVPNLKPSHSCDQMRSSGSSKIRVLSKIRDLLHFWQEFKAHIGYLDIPGWIFGDVQSKLRSICGYIMILWYIECLIAKVYILIIPISEGAVAVGPVRDGHLGSGWAVIPMAFLLGKVPIAINNQNSNHGSHHKINNYKLPFQ